MQGVLLGGRYRLERELGEGGMGRIFEATDQQLHRHVAIKVIREELTEPAVRDRFMREARAAAALNHPNVCQLYEVSEHEGRPFLVMELLHGEELSTRLARGPFGIDEAMAVMLPLMDAVSAFHQAGLVHRDLKPSNVFLTDDAVKLLDFGLARHVRSETSITAQTLTAPGAVFGTLRYMAPEQVTGDPIDARADIFALGILLYETLTGQVPFDATTNVAWLNAVLQQEPRPLGRPELRSFEPIVRRALQRRAADRYPSVDEMSADLHQAVNGANGDVPSTLDQSRALLVLPFHALREDHEIGFLENGVPEALTAALSTNSSLRVLSNREALRFGNTMEASTIGRELGVDRLIAGTLLRSNDVVRVTVQLVSVEGGLVEWSHTGQYDCTDALTLQDRICSEILDNLPDELSSSGERPRSRSQPEDSHPGSLENRRIAVDRAPNDGRAEESS